MPRRPPRTLVSIARNIGGFTGSGSFEGWITVIASNSARMTYRRLRRRADENGAAELPETADPRTTSVVAGTRLDLMEALSELERSKPQVVEPFVLRDLGSLPYEEIAVITGPLSPRSATASTWPGSSCGPR